MEKRMVADEREMLSVLFAISSLMENYNERFKRLMQRAPNGWRDFRMAQTRLWSLVEKIVETIPPQQAKIIKHHLDLTTLHIGVREAGLRPKDLWVMSYDDLAVLAEHATKTTCFVCDKNGKCELRNVLKNLPLGGVNTALVRCWEGE